LEINLPQAGYVPGQKIPVTVVVVNNTAMAVSELRLSLVMLVRYYSVSPEHSRVERIIISRAKGDSVLKQCTRSLTIDLPVPSTPPTCVELSNLIQIAYQLEVEALVKSLREQQLMVMPVTIGTIPLAVSGIVVQQPPRRSAHYEGPQSRRDPPDELPMVTALGSMPSDLTPSPANSGKITILHSQSEEMSFYRLRVNEPVMIDCNLIKSFFKELSTQLSVVWIINCRNIAKKQVQRNLWRVGVCQF